MENRLSLILIPALLLVCSLTFAQEYGTASYYSDDFDGMETAYGVKYNKNELTAAHKRHPYGTLLKVTRLDNKKSVTVKVIDKGPWIKGRIVDLSRKAASQLDLVNDGVADVKVEVVNTVAKADNKQPATTTTASIPKDRPTAAFRPVQNQSASTTADTRARGVNVATTTTAARPAAGEASKKVAVKADGNAKVLRQRFNTNGLYKIVLMKPEKKGFGVQVAALGSYENVLKTVANLQAKWFDNILVNSSYDKQGRPIYKVVLGPFESSKAASNYGRSLSSKHGLKGFVVDLAKLK